MNQENKPSFKEDRKSGNVTINQNGHIGGVSDYDYERLLRGCRAESTCYLCGERMEYTMTKNYETKINHIEGVSWKYERGGGIRRVFNERKCSMASHEKQEGAYKISIPTGELIIGNYFLDKDGEYAFDVPKEKQYSEKYNICNIKGQNNRAAYVAEKYNVGYVQINSSVELWATKERDKIILVMEPRDYEKFSKEDKKFNKEFEKLYEKIGELSQRVWRYEFADKSIIDNYNAEFSPDYDPITIKIPKGRYVVKHHYGKMYFRLNSKRYVIVTEIDLRSTTREILTEKIK